MDQTESIIHQLKDLGKTPDSSQDMCRMLRLQLRDFYDDIYIPYEYFRDSQWKINKVLYDNEDCLFYHENYVAEEDKEKFYSIFHKYVSMIEEIMLPENKLSIFLKKWTDKSGPRWKIRTMQSYLKSLLTHKDYQIISPLYITHYYCELYQKYRNDDKIKTEVENHLSDIVSSTRIAVKKFKINYHIIINSYVYEYPLSHPEISAETYVLGFLNSVFLEILDFIDALLDLNIYSIHPIISELIDFYIPLEYIITYDPKENNNRKLCIV